MTQEMVEFRNEELGYRLSGTVKYPDVGGEYPAVIFVHGFRSSQESSKAKALFEKLAEKNIVFLAFDLSGCGESEGEFADLTITKYVSDVKAAVNFMATLPQVNSSRMGLIGSSLGGMVSIIATEVDPRIKALVLVSPLSDFKARKGTQNREDLEMWRIEGIKETVNAKGRKFLMKYAFYVDGMKYDTYAYANKINCPVLVIHGDKDESVDISQSQELMKHLKQGNLQVIAGADHRYSQLSLFTHMIDLTVKFLEEKLR